MIKVDNVFYEKGLTITGEGNRVMLQKDGETCIEMAFLGKKVKLKGFIEGHEEHSATVNFGDIYSINIDNANPPLPAVILL